MGIFNHLRGSQNNATATTDTTAPVTRRTPLKEADRQWAAKTVLRAIIIVFNIVAIGCIAWTIASPAPDPILTSNSDYYNDYNYNNTSSYAWGFIPIGLSVIWCAVWMLILFIRRKPAHPGFAVGFDLVLWLATGIVAGIYDTLGGVNLYDGTGYNQPYDSSTYPGCSNDEIANSPNQYADTNCNRAETAIPNDYSYTYTFSNGSITTRAPSSTDYLCPGYDSCYLQDTTSSPIAQYEDSLNAYYHKIAVVGLVGAIFISLVAIIHFVLWIWACVDTHRYNRNNRSQVSDQHAKLLANQMIHEMRMRGELPPQQVPLINHDTSYQGGMTSNQSLPNAHGQGLPSGQSALHQYQQHPAYRPAQYASPPQPGNSTAYQPVSTVADGDAIQQTPRAL